MSGSYSWHAIFYSTSSLHFFLFDSHSVLLLLYLSTPFSLSVWSVHEMMTLHDLLSPFLYDTLPFFLFSSSFLSSFLPSQRLIPVAKLTSCLQCLWREWQWQSCRAIVQPQHFALLHKKRTADMMVGLGLGRWGQDILCCCLSAIEFILLLIGWFILYCYSSVKKLNVHTIQNSPLHFLHIFSQFYIG